MSEDLSISRVKVYCPKCEDVYVPRIKFVDIDGAYFGCSFPHIFLQTFPELLPTNKPHEYYPRIFGFKIYGKKGSNYKGQIEEDKELNNNINIEN
jgi:casein kinase II subunit beta